MQRIRIGRGGDADIDLDDPSVARRHADLKIADDRKTVTVSDLGSPAGTLYLDGSRWRPVGDAPLGIYAPLLFGNHMTTARDLLDELEARARAAAPPKPEPEPEAEPEPETEPGPEPEPETEPGPEPEAKPEPDPDPEPEPVMVPAPPGQPRPRLKGGGAAPVVASSQAGYDAAFGDRPDLVVTYRAGEKTKSVAYVLLFFLGVWGAHRYYMGRVLTGAAMTVSTIAGLMLLATDIGAFLVGAVFFWATIDAFLIPGWVRTANDELSAKIIAAANSMPKRGTGASG